MAELVSKEIQRDLITPEDLECPNCGMNLNEEGGVFQDLLDDPFNGVHHECGECGQEMSLHVLIQITYIGKDS